MRYPDLDYMFETGTILLTNFEFIGSSIILAKQTYPYRKVWLYDFTEDNAALVHSLFMQVASIDLYGYCHGFGHNYGGVIGLEDRN